MFFSCNLLRVLRQKMAAFCSLEEAYGNDYKSSISPASLEPNWLAKRKQEEIHQSRRWKETPSGVARGVINYEPDVIENFDGKTKNVESNNDTYLEDADLFQDYDEFNLPLKLPNSNHSPHPRSDTTDIDDYYKLINNQYDTDTINNYRNNFKPGYTAAGDYETESPYSDEYTHHQARFHHIEDKSINCKRLDSLKQHISGCKECIIKVKKWLNEIEGKSDNKDEGGITNGLLSKLINSTSLDDVKEPATNPYKSYIELLFFIGIGVFIIFILDTFVKLGRVLRRRR